MPLPGDVVILENVHSKFFLNVQGNWKGDGVRLQLWDNPEREETQWLLIDAGDNAHYIRSVSTGKNLDVKDQATDDGAVVHQWAAHTGDSSKWLIECPGKTKIYLLKNVRSGKYLAADGPAQGSFASLSSSQDSRAKWMMESVVKKTRGGFRTLFHVTTPEAAEAIVRSQKFLLGKRGDAGGGIYFATSPGDANKKAMVGGQRVSLTAQVRVGRSRPERTPCKQCGYGGRRDGRTDRCDHHRDGLRRAGYDSVLLTGVDTNYARTGNEIVVYDTSQVKDIKYLSPPRAGQHAPGTPRKANADDDDVCDAVWNVCAIM